MQIRYQRQRKNCLQTSESWPSMKLPPHRKHYVQKFLSQEGENDLVYSLAQVEDATTISIQNSRFNYSSLYKYLVGGQNNRKS